MEDWYNSEHGQPFASLEIARVIAAYACPLETHATTLLSVGPLASQGRNETFGRSSAPHREENEIPLLPLVLTKSIEIPDSSSKPARPTVKKGTAVLIRVPSVHIAISKSLLDGLQLWADDVSQWAEKLSTDGAQQAERRSAGVSRNPSMIGSRFFARRAGSGSTINETFGVTPAQGNTQSEFVVKSVVAEGSCLRLFLFMTLRTS